MSLVLGDLPNCNVYLDDVVIYKIYAILAYPVPTTRRELCRYIGIAGYYGCFCRNVSTVVAPLMRMWSPKVIFNWPDDCQNAFLCAKSLLCSAPVLLAPNVARPFQLEVETSATVQ